MRKIARPGRCEASGNGRPCCGGSAWSPYQYDENYALDAAYGVSCNLEMSDDWL